MRNLHVTIWYSTSYRIPPCNRSTRHLWHKSTTADKPSQQPIQALEQRVVRTCEDVQRVVRILHPVVQRRDGSVKSKDRQECRCNEHEPVEDRKQRFAPSGEPLTPVQEDPLRIGEASTMAAGRAGSRPIASRCRWIFAGIRSPNRRPCPGASSFSRARRCWSSAAGSPSSRAWGLGFGAWDEP